MKIEKVAVVGAGTMGSQIALQTAYSGRYSVALVDSSGAQLERARAQHRALAARAVEKGRLEADKAEAALRAIAYLEDLAAAVAGADLVIEAIPEDLELKRQLWRELGRLAPPEASSCR